MNRKAGLSLIIFIFIVTLIFFAHKEKSIKVIDVISPTEIVLNDRQIRYNDVECFDPQFTQKNKELSQKLNITENEAFIMGNIGRYWALNLLKGRYVHLADNSEVTYAKRNYKEKLKYSGFCIANSTPVNMKAFEKHIKNIRKSKYLILNLENDKAYEINTENANQINHFLVIKKFHLPKNSINHSEISPSNKDMPIISSGNIKVLFTDFTTKLKPDRNCSSSICQEILENINNSNRSIDIAIYGYSRTPEIEKALIKAKNRGVKIRLVYDSDIKGGNIYPDTNIIKSIIPNCVSDINSDEANALMHNKFYIFDNKVLITGSANLSHTDMSGFNSNIIAVIKSEEIAKIYEAEFEEMFNGKFHDQKTSKPPKSIDISGTQINIYFSPKDKSISNAIIPIINNAKHYIYIPTFVLTSKKVSDSLIAAKQRGVDVKIILDALNASVQHTKHKELRLGGISVKTENYAGKMHSKSMIIDDKYTIVGSMNFSNSGENRNDENIIVIANPYIAKAYKEFFLYQWNKIDNKWLKLNARAEGKDSIGSCTDGIDNNYDGLTDYNDAACK